MARRFNVCYQSSTSGRILIYAYADDLETARDLAVALADCNNAKVSWVCDTRDGSVPWQSDLLPHPLRRTPPPDIHGGG